MSIAQGLPSPTSPIPAVRQYVRALEACFGAKVLVEGIRRANKPVTRQSVPESLANLGSDDLGGDEITFGNGMQHGSKFVELAMVTREEKLSRR